MVWLVIAAAVLWLAVAAARLEQLSDLKSPSGGLLPVLAVATVVLIVGAFAWLDWGRADGQKRVREEEPPVTFPLFEPRGSTTSPLRSRTSLRVRVREQPKPTSPPSRIGRT